jgi:hypothetical protein
MIGATSLVKVTVAAEVSLREPSDKKTLNATSATIRSNPRVRFITDLL